MLTFNGDNLSTIWCDLIEDVLGEPVIGSRDGECQEHLGVTLNLFNPRNNFVWNEVRKASPVYAAAELLWYLSGSDDGRLVQYAPQYARFLNDGRAWGAYGRRWANGDLAFDRASNDLGMIPVEDVPPEQRGELKERRCATQVATLIQLLNNKPETRQAILTAWNAGDLIHAMLGGKNDLPCTLSIQFLRRPDPVHPGIQPDRLHCITTMRSNDIWLGVPYDVFCFTCLQQIVAEALGVEIGWYRHQVGSMHLYTRNRDKATESVAVRDTEAEGSRPLSFEGINGRWSVSDCIREAVGVEERSRQFKQFSEFVIEQKMGLGTMMGTMSLLVAGKWTRGRAWSFLKIPHLREMLTNNGKMEHVK